jgi:hypothetical protein
LLARNATALDVIPAKAGIQRTHRLLDSRLRGSDKSATGCPAINYLTNILFIYLTNPMDNTEKKQYEKPKVTRIKLDAKTAVLGICKTTGAGGPVADGCMPLGSPCSDQGS